GLAVIYKVNSPERAFTFPEDVRRAGIAVNAVPQRGDFGAVVGLVPSQDIAAWAGGILAHHEGGARCTDEGNGAPATIKGIAALRLVQVPEHQERNVTALANLDKRDKGSSHLLVLPGVGLRVEDGHNRIKDYQGRVHVLDGLFDGLHVLSK